MQSGSKVAISFEYGLRGMRMGKVGEEGTSKEKLRSFRAEFG